MISHILGTARTPQASVISVAATIAAAVVIAPILYFTGLISFEVLVMGLLVGIILNQEVIFLSTIRALIATMKSMSADMKVLRQILAATMADPLNTYETSDEKGTTRMAAITPEIATRIEEELKKAGVNIERDADDMMRINSSNPKEYELITSIIQRELDKEKKGGN